MNLKQFFFSVSQVVRIIWLLLAVSLIVSIARAQWETTFVAFVTFVLTLVPFIVRRRYQIHIPESFISATVFFIVATLFLGEVGDFYERFWWWDLLLHTGSAIGFGLIGVVILLLLYRAERVRAHPIFLAIFAFAFAVAIGALWEIFEFAMDQLFGFTMQKSGLVDTMWDLIVDSLGALVAAFSGYLYLVFGGKGWLRSLIHEAVENNR